MKRFTILSFLLIALSLAAKAADHEVLTVREKTITIRVNPNGTIYMDVDTLGTEMLSTILKDRLFKSYKGTGKMYERINIVFDGDVPMNTRNAVFDAVKDAQDKARTELCLQKHAKRFDQLSARQQSKIKKQFPVLFQQI